MKNHLSVMVTAVAITAGAIVVFPLVSSAQDPKKPATQPSTQVASPPASAQAPETWPGIIMSVSGSAIISTQGMPPGSEIWAEWYSLPPGQVVAESASAAKWAYVEMSLDGSAVVTGGPTPMCSNLNAGGRQGAGSERITDAGDVEVCNYAILPGSRTENRGSQPYVFAGLAVGGPWQEGMEDAADLYLKVNGLAKGPKVASSQFGEVEKEILKAGAMRVVIRRVTIPPGARIVATDHYPTLRMVENGQLTLGSIPEDSTAGAAKVLAALDSMQWVPANAGKQIVLSNKGEQPVQFVEWIVAPSQGAIP